MSWKRKKYVVPAGIRTRDCPPVTLSTPYAIAALFWKHEHLKWTHQLHEKGKKQKVLGSILLMGGNQLAANVDKNAKKSKLRSTGLICYLVFGMATGEIQTAVCSIKSGFEF
jgi:hypothetical protein